MENQTQLLQDLKEKKSSVVVVMPAYNAAKTLEKTYKAIPPGTVREIILVDDHSHDETIEIARSLNITTFKHTANYGYGANQKTCYTEALKTGHGIIVMLHPDFQYDPSLIPKIIEPITNREADVVLGSRLLNNRPIKQGMPWWKYISNRFLTFLENVVFGLNFSEYHTGYRAYSRRALEQVNFQINSDKFVFDQEIITQFVANGCVIKEVSVPARYFPDASSANFIQSVKYGLSILWLLFRYLLHKHKIIKQSQFEILHTRYQKIAK